MHRDMERLWQLEIGDAHSDVKSMSVQDKSVVSLWDESVVQVKGHYELPIPFRDSEPRLPANQDMAASRLASLGRRLRKDNSMLAQYSQGMDNLIVNGYAVKVPECELGRDDGRVWYLPHHPVVNPNKSKVRIVFDCAAKCKGVSLNDKVLPGPDLTNSLVGVLSRFRLRRVALMADIEAMFHQVSVTPEDRDVLRFLWWPNGDITSTPAVYRMNVHLFGGTWSPSCCTYALRRVASDNARDFLSSTLDTVCHDFYVDDCLKSVDSVEDAVRLYAELTDLLRKGGFNLTKWLSNEQAVLSQIPMNSRSPRVRTLDIGSPLEERALGVGWDLDADELLYKVGVMDKPLTRRGLLSMLSSVYDPLGLASPFILPARCIVQELCRTKHAWDDMIPQQQAEAWASWIRDLQGMSDVRFSRRVQDGDGEVTRELHHFSDASEIAYGVASYLRVERPDGVVSSQLVMAKSRLAPLKPLTIPRLELCAATLATRQDAMLRRELDVEIASSHFWTDSTLVLQYVRSEDRRFHTYMSNRVTEIRGQTELGNWHHVPTKDNPADDASRGLSASGLMSSRWQRGPAFLSQPPSVWPTLNLSPLDSRDPELKRAPIASLLIVAQDDPIERLLNAYSDWTRLLRAVAWVLLVRDACRQPDPMPDALRAEDLDRAEEAVLYHVQSTHFNEELKSLAETGKVQKRSKLAALQPKLRAALWSLGDD